MTRTFRNPWLIPSLAVAAATAMLAGCDAARTDTGYEPHRLKMNDSQIRALYAPAFSPEAQNAKDEEKQTLHNIHPGGGPGGAY